MNPPKKILCILILVFSFFLSYSQSEKINGIQIKVPDGFVYQEENKSIDFWLNKDDKKLFGIQYVKKNSSHSSYESRKAIKSDSETTEYIDFTTLEILGNKYDIQTNINWDTQVVLTTTFVYREGYLYTLTYGFEFDIEKLAIDKKYAANLYQRITKETINFIKMILTS